MSDNTSSTETRQTYNNTFPNGSTSASTAPLAPRHSRFTYVFIFTLILLVLLEGIALVYGYYRLNSINQAPDHLEVTVDPSFQPDPASLIKRGAFYNLLANVNEISTSLGKTEMLTDLMGSGIPKFILPPDIGVYYYDHVANLLTRADLSQIKPGDKVIISLTYDSDSKQWAVSRIAIVVNKKN